MVQGVCSKLVMSFKMRWIVILVLAILLFPGSAKADLDMGVLGDLLELAKHATKVEKIVVRSTECDVKCGLGSKTETRCYVESVVENGPEVLSECEDVVVECHGIWECGVKPYSANIGANLNLDCQSVPLVGHKENTMSYHWTFSEGVITTDDDAFDESISNERIVKLYQIQERNAGTYRCQMDDSNGKLVKVIYFAVRVIDPSVFNLNVRALQAQQHQQYLLAIKEAAAEKFQALSYNQQVYIIIGVGIGANVPLAIVLSFIFRALKRKKRGEKDVEKGDPEGEG